MEKLLLELATKGGPWLPFVIVCFALWKVIDYARTEKDKYASKLEGFIASEASSKGDKNAQATQQAELRVGIDRLSGQISDLKGIVQEVKTQGQLALLSRTRTPAASFPAVDERRERRSRPRITEPPESADLDPEALPRKKGEK
jgi:hypothetical protein